MAGDTRVGGIGANRENPGRMFDDNVPVNLYGRGDDFDAGASHVIPAPIRRCVDVRRPLPGGLQT